MVATMEPMTAMTPDIFADMRRAMVVSQLRPNGVNDPRVLDAMGIEPREDYVPAERRTTAYADRVVPLPEGRAINPPTVTGMLFESASIAPADRVLVVADPSGYTTAIARRLARSVSTQDGPAAATGAFDVIVVDGAVEQVPQVLVDALDIDGRLVAGVVEAGVTRLAVGRRGGDGFALIPFMDADIAILPQFARPRAFSF